MMEQYERPTSEWDHPHALEVGDVIVVDGRERWEIIDILEEGLKAKGRPVDGKDDNWQAVDHVEILPHFGVAAQLSHGEMHRERDGLSHELATF